MAISTASTAAQKTLALEKRALEESVFLANDVMNCLENREFEVTDIKETEQFKKLILSNVNFTWENELTDFQKRFYHQNLYLLASTIEEQKQYFNNLAFLASNDIYKRVTDFINKYPGVAKIIIKKPTFESIFHKF